MSNSSNDLTAKIRIDGDAKGAQQAIDVTDQGLQQLEATGKRARSSTEQLNSSFATLGIRSAAQIKSDMLAIDQALIRLASNSRLSGEEFDRAFAAGQEQLAKLRAELGQLPVEPTTRGVSGLTDAFGGLKGVLGALGVSAVGEKFLEANLAADKLQKSLNAVNGDATKTASDLEFLKETAQRLGINLESSAAGFVKLAASAKGTSLEGQATRDIFTGLGSAMSQLGLSSADTERAFVAVAQMMGKGTIQAEELKGQLGDVLPGAMAIAARATGLTTQELAKLMEAGGLLAEDFLPKFAAEAQKSFGSAAGEVQGLSNTIERTKNTWSQAFKIFGDTGVMASLAGALGVVNEAFLLLATGVTTVVSGFFAFVKAVSVTVAAIVTLDFSHLKDSLAEIGNELIDNVAKMGRLTGTSKLVSAALNETGNSAQVGAAKVAGATVGWEKLVVAYDQAAKSAADYVEQAKKVAKANDEQQSVLVKLAQLSGNENDLLRAKEDAARKAADGASNLAQALDREAKTLQAKAIALQEEIKGLKNVSEEKLKAIEEAKKAADAKTEEARAALSSADASRVAAAAAEAEAAARYDNSQRVKELKEAYEQATLQVTVLKAAQVAGVDVTIQLTAAQTAAAKAHALYNDALKDQVDRIGQVLQAKQSQINIEQAGLRLAIEQQKSIMDVARAKGDEYTASLALIETKKLELKLADLTAQAKKAEAEAAMLAVAANREYLQSIGQLTPAKEAELKAQEASAKVKQVEAQIAAETARKLRELADANIFVADSASSAAGSLGGFTDELGAAGKAAATTADDYDRLANSIDGVSKSTRQAASGPITSTATSSNGGTQLPEFWTSPDGRNIVTFDPRKEALKAGATTENIDEIVSKATLEIERIRANNNGNMPTASQFQQIIPAIMREMASNSSASAQQSGGSSLSASSSHTVTINLGSQSKTLNLASSADASQLVSILQQLETDSARAY